MLDTIKAWFDWLAPLVVGAWPWARSVCMGYGGAIGLTQVVKFWIPGEVTDDAHRRLTRALAAGLAIILIGLTWPTADRWLWAVALGSFCPIVVKGVLLVLYWKFPGLESRLSARPAV